MALGGLSSSAAPGPWLIANQPRPSRLRQEGWCRRGDSYLKYTDLANGVGCLNQHFCRNDRRNSPGGSRGVGGPTWAQDVKIPLQPVQAPTAAAASTTAAGA